LFDNEFRFAEDVQQFSNLPMAAHPAYDLYGSADFTG